jgi:murein DD-endopeptidase MepM/ murein hydrolase activator NlpD
MIFLPNKKSHFVKILLGTIALSVFLINPGVWFGQNVSIVSADTIDEIKAKIDQTNKTKDDLEREIAQYEAQLKEIGLQKNTFQTAIKTIDINTKKIQTDIKLNENRIANTNLKIEQLGGDIKSKGVKIDNGLDIIQNLLQQINRADNTSIIENLLQNKNLSEIWKEIETAELIQNQIRNKTLEIQDIKTSLENTKKETEAQKKELLILKSKLNDQKTILNINRNEKSKLLAQTKNQESNYNKILAEKKAKRDAFEKELTAYENQLKLAIDPNSIPNTGNGTLSWPLNNIRITQFFGKTVDAKRLYASGTHNGIDFAATIGSVVKASANGVIEGTGDTDVTCSGASFGKWILIRHYNGLSTLYGHLSLIKVKAGDVIYTGDTIAYSGNTGYSTGPHLHFTVYATQGVKITNYKSAVCKGTYTMPVADTRAYLDPMVYLPK